MTNDDFLKEIENVYKAFAKIALIDRELIDIASAVAISPLAGLEVPLWVAIVGVPSSGKTELVRALKGKELAHAYFLDTMTSNPFASGYVAPKGHKSFDLLSELDAKCLIIRDMTTMFSLADETLKKLLGELVAIYDAEFAKYSPTKGLQEFNAQFSLLGCITPAALDRHARYLAMIGARMLFVRVNNLTDDAKQRGFEIAWGSQNRKGLVNEARTALRTYLQQVCKNIPTVSFEDERVQERLNALATLISRARGVAITKAVEFENDEGQRRKTYEIEELQVEEPWRALLQLRSLGRALAIVRGKSEVGEEEIQTLLRVALSSMPPERAELIGAFVRKDNEELTAKELEECMPNRSRSTINRLLLETVRLELMERKPLLETPWYRYCLTKETWEGVEIGRGTRSETPNVAALEEVTLS